LFVAIQTTMVSISMIDLVGIKISTLY